VFNDLIDLVLPRTCFGCGRAGATLCGTCLVADPRQPYPGVFAAAPYEGALRAALIAYKERGRRDLATPLATLLSVALAEFGSDVVLVPVPSSRKAAAARGGDHVLRIARRCRRPVVQALSLRPGARDSAGLSTQQRRENRADAFRARPPRTAPHSAPRSAVLVDDIVTTGATLYAARHALSEVGWQVLGAATVAETPLRWGARRPIAPGSTRSPENQ
jgi:predicted amidophosphoribosyltransferase